MDAGRAESATKRDDLERKTNVHARLKQPAMVIPEAMQALWALGAATHGHGLPRRTAGLVHLRASQINGCGVCVEMHARGLKQAGESDERLFAVAAWRESPYFTDAERAALAFAEEATRLADASAGVSDETWAHVRKHYDDDQLAALVSLVALVNAANRLAVPVHLEGGSYEPGMFAAMTS